MNLAQLKERRTDILALAQKFGASNVRVIGSVARGQDDDKSDVDFLVHLDESTGLMDWVHLGDELEKMLGVHVDVVEEAALSGKFRQRALKDAIKL